MTGWGGCNAAVHLLLIDPELCVWMWCRNAGPDLFKCPSCCTATSDTKEILAAIRNLWCGWVFCCFARCFFHEVSGFANSWRWLIQPASTWKYIHLNFWLKGVWHVVFVESLQIQEILFTCCLPFSSHWSPCCMLKNSQILPMKKWFDHGIPEIKPKATQRYQKLWYQWIRRDILQEPQKHGFILKKKRFSNPTHWIWLLWMFIRSWPQIWKVMNPLYGGVLSFHGAEVPNIPRYGCFYWGTQFSKNSMCGWSLSFCWWTPLKNKKKKDNVH